MIDNLNLLSPIDFNRMTIDKRRTFISGYVRDNFMGKSFFCPALNKKVRVTAQSVKETAAHAAKSPLSVIMAINMPKVIENVRYVFSSDPKQGTQTKRFFARKTLVLMDQTSLGCFAKLTVVERGNQYYVEYCVTAKEDPTIKLLRNIVLPSIDGEIVRVQKKHSRQ